MVDPPFWTPEELEFGRQRAIATFRRERLEEPLEAYLTIFDRYQGVLEEVVEATVDLSSLRANALDLLADRNASEALRFLTGPPISSDDLKIIVEGTLSGKKLKADPEMVERIIDVIVEGLDKRRFPWISEQREAYPHEREAAVLATAALIASSKTMTLRRNEGKTEQEKLVEETLIGHGLKKVSTRNVQGMSEAPAAGEFCRESLLSGRKADFIVGLLDGRRIMPIECKVSNSSTNSVKRLNNDAARRCWSS